MALLLGGVTAAAASWLLKGEKTDEDASEDATPNVDRGSSEEAHKEMPKPECPPTFLTMSQSGIEDWVRDEILMKAKEHAVLKDYLTESTVMVDPIGVRGYVGVYLPADTDKTIDEATVELLMNLRSVLDIMRYHCHFKISDEGMANKEAGLKEINDTLRQPSISVHTLETAKSFRVTATRIGQHHKFASFEIGREAGEALHERYGVPGDMTNFDVNIRVNVILEDVVVGTQLNGDSLTKRHKDEFVNVVTIKSNLAYCLLQLARVKPGSFVVDPFCGSGTILLEAAALFDGNMKALGCDCSAKAVKGAIRNVQKVNYQDVVSVIKCDARSVHREIAKESVDCVVTNPPWGVQTGKDVDLEQLYKFFLQGAYMILKPGGYVTMIVLRGLLVLEVVRALGLYEIETIRVVQTRNNLPTIFVLKKKAEDEMKIDLRNQLYSLGKYINLSSGLFSILHDQFAEKSVNNQKVDDGASGGQGGKHNRLNVWKKSPAKK